MTPTVTMEAPSVVTMKSGSTLWINSEEASMKSEPKPNAQMPAGITRHDADVVAGIPEGFEGAMCNVPVYFSLPTSVFSLTRVPSRI